MVKSAHIHKTLHKNDEHLPVYHSVTLSGLYFIIIHFSA